MLIHHRQVVSSCLDDLVRNVPLGTPVGQLGVRRHGLRGSHQKHRGRHRLYLDFAEQSHVGHCRAQPGVAHPRLGTLSGQQLTEEPQADRAVAVVLGRFEGDLARVVTVDQHHRCHRTPLLLEALGDRVSKGATAGVTDKREGLVAVSGVDRGDLKGNRKRTICRDGVHCREAGPAQRGD